MLFRKERKRKKKKKTRTFASSLIIKVNVLRFMIPLYETQFNYFSTKKNKKIEASNSYKNFN